jgi:hypothetical protein
MAGIDLTTAQTMLDAYIAAEKAVLAGQAYQIGGRSMRLADLPAIQEGRKKWNDEVQRLTSSGGRSGMRVRGVTPTG